jgi:lysophospholipase L1-like esterase
VKVRAGMAANRPARSELRRGTKLVLIAAMSVVTLLLLESGARAIFAMKAGRKALLYGIPWLQREPPVHTVMDHGNRVAGYTKYFPNETKRDYKPDTHEEFPVAINGHGFRGHDFSDQKPAGVVRVVTLGASSTFGYHDRDDETYPYYLEQRLNAKAGKRFEVINLGIPHLRSWEILALFRAEGLPLEPDVVTFYEAINDSVADLRPSEAPDPGPKQGLRTNVARVAPLRAAYRWLRDHFIVLGFADSFLTVQSVWSYTPADVEQHGKGKVERFLANVAAIDRLCQEHKILFIVMKQQAKSLMFDDLKGVSYQQEVELVQQKLERGERIPMVAMAFLTHRRLTDALGAWALANGVPLVDVIELLNDRRELLWTWVHLHPEANAAIADALAAEIRLQVE